MSKKKNFFEFNHIDIKLGEEKLKQIMDLYKYYHKKIWIYKHSHSRKRKKITL